MYIWITIKYFRVRDSVQDEIDLTNPSSHLIFSHKLDINFIEKGNLGNIETIFKVDILTLVLKV